MLNYYYANNQKNIFNNNMKSIQYMFFVEENILKIYNMTKGLHRNIL